MPLPISQTQNPEIEPPPPEVVDNIQQETGTDNVTQVVSHDALDNQYSTIKKYRDISSSSIHVVDHLSVLADGSDDANTKRLAGVIDKENPDSATEIAQEILQLNESPLFSGLIDNAQRLFPPNQGESETEYKDRIQGLIDEIKKPLFELLATGRLSASDIERFVCGGIRIVDKPAEDISHAVASISAHSGMPQLTFYKGYFDRDKNPDRDHHIVKHEIGHVVAAQIFAGKMPELEQIAGNPEASTDDLPPHLKMVIAMIRHPEKAALREHRGDGSHLYRELIKLATLEKKPGVDAQELAKARARLVREILAERAANYFECDGTLEGYAALRFGNIDPELMDKNDPHFLSEQMMFETIQQGLTQKDQWQFGSEAPQIFADGWWDDYGPETFSQFENLQSAGAMRPQAKTMSTLEKFFAWLTGTSNKINSPENI